MRCSRALPTRSKPTRTTRSGPTSRPGESDMPGLKAGEAFRDPFDPLYWQVAPIDELKTETPAKPGTAAPAPSKAVMDAVAALKSAGRQAGCEGSGQCCSAGGVAQ